MTTFLLDVASYQGELATADVVRAGFGGVNLKISHGLTTAHVHPDVTGWVARSRAAGLRIATFHYLTGDPGDVQAEYAYARLVALGIEDGTAHQVDVEAPTGMAITWPIVVAYVARMQTLLGRPIAIYTGDWWWPAAWPGSTATPYLWAAPNAGYLSAYPGDVSPAWGAGYGGWHDLAIMQYAVGPLIYPAGDRGSIDVSKSAIRDESVWRDLTTGRPGMTVAPKTLKDDRTYILAHLPIDPLSVGIVGDDNHAATGNSYHLGKSALRADSYSIVESSRDRAGLSEAASALDVGWFSIKVAGKTHTLRTFSAWLVAQCVAGTKDTLDIREVIYSLDGASVRRWDRLKKRTTGDSSHLTHTHISRFRDAEDRGLTPLFLRYFIEIGLVEGDFMAFIDDQAAFNTALDTYFKAKQRDTENPVGGAVVVRGLGSSLTVTVGMALQTGAFANTNAALVQLAAIGAKLDAIGAKVDVELSDHEATAEDIAAAFMAGLDQIGPADAATALLAVLGTDKARAIAAAVLGTDNAEAVAAILAKG